MNLSVVPPPPAAPVDPFRCVYCGRKLRDLKSLACSYHRDLLALDPCYQP